ncbi:hypothetical protein HJG60_011539 [Phyllostomus discolor]|uniref:Uncharacterized protein n=1 Tax=Phyllostomus discolor TaxID=89673 RepID=A0A833ZVZ2_9CHIR|nr:hypothetical protein HJG60_011539 [Phyllostomus discolor]
MDCDGLLTAHGSLSASDSSRLMSRSPWHNLIRMWPLSLVQLYAMEMSNESFETSSTFISLSLFTLLSKLIVYLLCRSCSSVSFDNFPQQERKVGFTGAVDSKADLTLPGRQKETAEVTSTSTPESSLTLPVSESRRYLFAAMFQVIQQILAEHPWCARPCARSGEGGRGSLGPAHEELLCSVTGCL